MFCEHCGNEIKDTAKFCPRCGKPVAPIAAAGTSFNAHGASTIPVVAPSQSGHTIESPAGIRMTNMTTPVGQTPYEQKLAQAASMGLGMNWYKFIIYVQCFLSLVSGLASGVMSLTGAQYGSERTLAYGFYPSLHTLDIIIGISSILIGLLALYARFGLKGFKAAGLNIYLPLPILSTLVNIIYIVAASSILDISPFDRTIFSVSTIAVIAGGIVLFIINLIYFGKRRQLFTN